MKKSTIEQELKEHGHSFFQTVGDSMEPLLHHRSSTVVIAEITAPLKRHDVVLYHRPPGSMKDKPEGAYVLHRIIHVRKRDCLIRGDNRVGLERVPRGWIFGVMTGYFNGDTFVDCATDAAYRRYVKTLGWRYAWRWCRALPRRVLGKIRRLF